MFSIADVCAVCIFGFGLIGLVRGFLKELGITIVLLATLFAIDRMIPLADQLILNGNLEFLGLQPFTRESVTDQPTTLLLTVAFEMILIFATLIAYNGEVLANGGRDPGPPIGSLLGLLFGMTNGYLVGGTLWQVMYHYNSLSHLITLHLVVEDATTAIMTNGLLPLDLLGAGIRTGDSLGFLPLILVALIILKVAR